MSERSTYEPPDDFSDTSNRLHDLLKPVRRWQSFCANPSSELCNKPFMLLVGEAGQGKTHRLCDVARLRGEA